tara:strand:- start:3334 stop:3819 length:486 start_codon:yes stop_codon:yes gene_type:complete
MYPAYTKETNKQFKRIIESWASLQWKVLGHHYTRIDLIQEGWLIMERIASRYPDRDDGHILSTLARSLQNKSRDLSKKPDRLPAVSDLSEADDSLPPPAVFDSPSQENYPAWLERALDFASKADSRELAAIGGPKGNRYLAEKCGLPKNYPVKKMVLRAIG